MLGVLRLVNMNKFIELCASNQHEVLHLLYSHSLFSIDIYAICFLVLIYLTVSCTVNIIAIV